jgi:hypothetical protein
VTPIGERREPGALTLPRAARARQHVVTRVRDALSAEQDPLAGRAGEM